MLFDKQELITIAVFSQDNTSNAELKWVPVVPMAINNQSYDLFWSVEITSLLLGDEEQVLN